MTDFKKFGAETAKESLVLTADNPSAHILRTIEVVVEHLREKRSRIEEIQVRHDRLVNEISQLNKTLESENIDFVSKLKAVINDLDTDSAIVELHPDKSAATGTSELDADGLDRDQLVQKPADDKPVKRGSLRWLKDKEPKRRQTSKPIISGSEDSG